MTSFPTRADMDYQAAEQAGPFVTAILAFFDVVLQFIGAKAASELTIASGSVTPTQGSHTIDTEADAGADDLTHIDSTNLPDGFRIFIRGEDAARVVTVKDAAGGAGEIMMTDSADFVLDALNKWLLLERRGALWQEIGRSLLIGTNVQGYDSGISTTPHTQGKHAIPVIARALKPTETNGCAALAIGETGANKINYEYLAFDASAEEKCFVKFAAPKSSDETAGIFIRNLKWSHPATATNFGVVWEFEALAVGNDDALDAAVGTAVTVADTGGTTEDIYSAPESAAITPAGAWAEGDDIYLQVSRKVLDGSDTLGVDAYLHGFEIVITSNAGNDA